MIYLLLGAAAVAMLVISFRGRCLRPVNVALLLVTGATIGWGDMFFSGVLHAYTYRPGLSRYPMADFGYGFLLADLFFVSVTIGTLYDLRKRSPWGYVLVPTAAFFLLEIALVRLGVFLQMNWRAAYSALLFLLYIALAGRRAARFEQEVVVNALVQTLVIVAAGAVDRWFRRVSPPAAGGHLHLPD